MGIEIGIRERVLTVISPLKGTPADRAGIRAGDIIVKIDDTLSADLRVEEAISLIKGERGTKVTLTLIREGEDEPLVAEITRDVISIPIIETDLKNDVFIITLYSFTGGAETQFAKAMSEFASSSADKLILDLRGNPGGFLDSAVSIASWFIPKGELVVEEYYGEDKKTISHRSRGFSIGRSFEMIALVDLGSASASEIVAGALQDHKIVKLVGEATFGKGSVQELVPITADTMLKITVAEWHTPNGSSISKEGLTPDVAVEFTRDDFEKGKDPQMEKAIEMLRE